MPMSMSYCRMENTFRQLREAQEQLRTSEFAVEELSDSEARYLKSLLRVCREMVEEFDDVPADEPTRR